jgi:Pyruvate/2-oxoacid:ferredoxin oxidoreductase delta subunit
MSKLEEFIRVFQLPPAMVPYINFVVTEQEMDLVVAMGTNEMTLEEIARIVGMPMQEAEEFVTKAFHRAVIMKVGAEYGHQEGETATGPTRYKAGTFYRRLDPMAMYESWGDIPAQVRDGVVEWQLQEFINMWRPAIDKILETPDAQVHIPNRDFILLEEALQMVDAATNHVVVPCDCRAIVRACNRPVEVCVRLDQGAIMTLEHGHGRRVTKEEMKRIIVDADRAGLMHTGDRDWREHGKLFGFCNCCACDCYPIRAGGRLGLDRAWPRSHYVAERDPERCVHCGRCVARCHFGACYHDGTKVKVNGKLRRAVFFDPEKCRGCGICATTCPEAAIEMRPL